MEPYVLGMMPISHGGRPEHVPLYSNGYLQCENGDIYHMAKDVFVRECTKRGWDSSGWEETPDEKKEERSERVAPAENKKQLPSLDANDTVTAAPVQAPVKEAPQTVPGPVQNSKQAPVQQTVQKKESAPEMPVPNKWIPNASGKEFPADAPKESNPDQSANGSKKGLHAKHTALQSKEEKAATRTSAASPADTTDFDTKLKRDPRITIALFLLWVSLAVNILIAVFVFTNWSHTPVRIPGPVNDGVGTESASVPEVPVEGASMYNANMDGAESVMLFARVVTQNGEIKEIPLGFISNKNGSVTMQPDDQLPMANDSPLGAVDPYSDPNASSVPFDGNSSNETSEEDDDV